MPHDAGLHRVEWDLRGNAPAGLGGGRGGQSPRGPQVLPGEYVVKMMAGGNAFEQKVKVELDPELKVSEADLREQWDALERISKLILATAEMPGQAKLLQQLQSLYGLMEAPNDAPTGTMTNLLAELESEFTKARTATVK